MKTKQTQDTTMIKIRISMNYERKRSKNKVVLYCAFSRYEKTQKWNPAARFEGLVETPWWNDYVATTWYNNQRSPSSKCFHVFSMFTCLFNKTTSNMWGLYEAVSFNNTTCVWNNLRHLQTRTCYHSKRYCNMLINHFTASS